MTLGGVGTIGGGDPVKREVTLGGGGDTVVSPWGVMGREVMGERR